MKIGANFLLFPMRVKDYDLVREVLTEEIRKVVRNMEGIYQQF